MRASGRRPQSGNYSSGRNHHAKTKEEKKGSLSQIFTGLFHDRFEGKTRSLSGVQLELLDRVDLLCRVQALGAGMRAVLDGVAAVELELVVDGVQALLGELVTAVLYPPGTTNGYFIAQEPSWYAKHALLGHHKFKVHKLNQSGQVLHNHSIGEINLKM
jgi:hypothetical protein